MKIYLWASLLGFVLGIGVRVSQYLIPAPETRVVVCFASDLNKVQTCTTAKTLLDRVTEDGEQ